MAPLTTSSTAEITTVASAAVFTAAPPTPTALPFTSSSIIAPPPPAPTTSSTEAPPLAQPTSAAVEPGAKSAPTGAGKQGGISGAGQFNGLGIGYDIIDDQDGCKSAATVANDLDTMTGYSVVRIYGITCNQVALVTAEAAQRGMKVFVSIDDPTANLASAIQSIVSQAGSNLGVIDTIAIGNEYVQNHPGAVAVVTAAVGVARAALSGIFSGNVVTVDTCGVLTDNPALCAASDYCAANCHAFFDPNTPAAGAGAYVQNQIAGVAAANPGKSVIVTESGWAWKDPTGVNGRATLDQQAAAISSLRAAFSSNLFLFQGFDTMYKQHGTEQYFGIYDHDD